MRKTYRLFTADEEQYVRLHYPTEGPKKVAMALDRPRRSVIAKAHAIGAYFGKRLRQNARKEWSSEEDGMIRDAWPTIQRRIKGSISMSSLAKNLGVSRYELQRRAYSLGCRSNFVREPDWSEEEMELLGRWAHLSIKTISQKLKQKGFSRSPTAVGVKRNRLQYRVSESSESYSATGLARLMGVGSRTVGRYIDRGWLPAKPRTESRHADGSVGDRWLINPMDVRRMLLTHTAHIDHGRCDKYWLFDLLAGGARQDKINLPHLQQDSCGSGDTEDFTVIE